MNKKLDLNTIIGFLLVGAIIVYITVFDQRSPEAAAAAASQDSTQTEVVAEERPEITEEPSLPIDTILAQAPSDTMAYLKAVSIYGPFAKQMMQEPETSFYQLENEVLRLTVSSLGGQIVSAELKNYRTYDSLPLHLIDKGNSNFGFTLQAGQLRSTAQVQFSVLSQSADQLSLQARTDDGAQIVYRYKLPQNDYRLDLKVETEGMSGLLAGEESALLWELKALHHEKNKKTEIQSSEMMYRLVEDQDVESFNTTSEDEEKAEGRLDWFAFRQQFFTSILQSKGEAFSGADFRIASLDEEGFTKYYAANVRYPKTGTGEIDLPLGIYLGPNKFEILDAYGEGFEELIPLGWGILGWINRGIVLNVFMFLEDYGLNYGLVILIIALLIKMVLFPLTYTSYRSMAKMRVLKPEIDALNEKYEDPMKRQQATLELYNKAGVSPLGGCLPMLLQFPILIALFRFFPASIELRQQPFLWATDLSTYDSIYDLPFDVPFYGDHISLFTLLMTVSTLIYTYMNQQLTGSAQNQQFPQMKYIIYLMPIMFLGVFNSYAAGLSYYYFVANMITFGQQFAIRSFIDEDKIKAKIAKRKEGPQKENRLMRRMREMQDQQGDQANRQQRRKK